MRLQGLKPFYLLGLTAALKPRLSESPIDGITSGQRALGR
jgi:hypothetical protein